MPPPAGQSATGDQTLDSDQRSEFMLPHVDDLVPIGEFAQRSGLSQKRLRSYAAAGLLMPTSVDPSSGYRYYSPRQLRTARLIDALREAGMPLAEIAEVFRDPSSKHLDIWARHVELDAQQRRQALDNARELLGSEAFSFRPGGEDPLGRKVSMTQLNAVSRSEVGQVRENNEDDVVTSDCLAVVADGMGGHPGGEVASTVAVSLVHAAYTGGSIDELQAATRAANRAIWDRANASADLEGMGTTICAVGLSDQGCLAVVHVGDSRAYLMHQGALRKLTHDHSVTADLVRRGELNEAEAHLHPMHGYLTRALGAGPNVEVDGAKHPASAGDRLLVCSDGLVNEVSDEEIASFVEAGDAQAVVDGLIELAQTRGGRDDISVIVADISA
jgi:PPM family protein phosphatase